jgi:hypothetical protein
MTSASLPVPVGRQLLQQMTWQERAACVMSLVLIGVLIAPVPPVLRLIVALAFVVVAPGTALLAVTGSSLFGDYHPGLIVGLGLAQIILLGEIALWVHAFYARPELAGFAVVVFAVVVFAVHRRVRPSSSAFRDGSDAGAALFIPPGVTSALDEGGINLLPTPAADVQTDADEGVADDRDDEPPDAAAGPADASGHDASDTGPGAVTDAPPDPPSNDSRTPDLTADPEIAADPGDAAVEDASEAGGVADATDETHADDADTPDNDVSAPVDTGASRPDAPDGDSATDDSTSGAGAGAPGSG